MTWFDVLVKVVDRADDVLDKVRKTPRKRLGTVPEPNAPPDPFSVPVAKAADSGAKAAEPGAKSAIVEPPLGNPELPAQIFGKRTDPTCGLAVQLFRDRGIDATFTNLDDPDNQQLELRLVRETKQYELPYVYLRGEHVGGFAVVAELARDGKLEERTQKR